MDERRKRLLTWIGCASATVMLCLLSINHAIRIGEEDRSVELRRLMNELGGPSEPNAEWQAAIDQINQEQRAVKTLAPTAKPPFESN